jgi:hypothetical protein
LTQSQRDVAEKDYESWKDDIRAEDHYAQGAGASGLDFERDSERPR